MTYMRALAALTIGTTTPLPELSQGIQEQGTGRGCSRDGDQPARRQTRKADASLSGGCRGGPMAFWA